MKEDERLEGSGASKMVQLIKKFGHNTDINIELGTVTASPPALKIKIDNMNLELEADDLIVAMCLTKHKRTITFKTATSTTDAEIEYTDELKKGDRVIVAEINKGQTYVILDRAVIY